MRLLTGDLARQRFGLPYIAAVHVRTWLTWCLAELGEFDEAIALGGESARIAEAAGHPFSLTSACAGLARPQLRRGNFAAAIEALERGLAICRTWNIRLLLPTLTADLGLAYAMIGRLGEALPLLERAAESQASMRGTAGQSPRFTSAGEAHLLAGHREQAVRCAERALELARLHRERGYQAYGLRLLGATAARAEPADPERANTAYRAALALADELEMRALAGRCHLDLAELHRTAGNVALARDAAADAVSLFEALGMTFWLERARAEQRALRGTP